MIKIIISHLIKSVQRNKRIMMLIFIIICLWIRDSTANDEPKASEAKATEESKPYVAPGKTPMPEEPPISPNFTEAMMNTTSCDEFLADTTFDPFKVIDIDWKIWYFWNHQFEETYNIKFSIPAKTLVDRFRVELDGEIQPPVNWSNAILFMETSIDFSALFVKTESEGQFRVVPSLAFEYTRLPELIFGLKVIEPPGYLAILNCKYRLCYALAPIDKMPYYRTYDEEAKKIGFRGNFGRSHIAISPAPPTLPPDLDEHDELHDDDDEDMHLELQRQFDDNMDTILI